MTDFKNLFGIFLAEVLGSFFFITVILTTGEAIPIGIALAAAITFGGFISGGHLNPAVSITLWAKGAITLEALPIYIIAQIIGGLLALAWYNSGPRKNAITPI